MAQKDWKKITFDDGSFKYVNKKRKGTLHMGNSLFSGKPEVTISIGTVKFQGAELTETNIHEEFSTKAQALAFAKRYMRKN